jgi:hypothetical protein
MFRGLIDSFFDSEELREESPATHETVRRILESEQGKFVIDSGILTPNEVAHLTNVQLGNWLRDMFAILRLSGRGLFKKIVPLLRDLALQRFKLPVSRWI